MALTSATYDCLILSSAWADYKTYCTSANFAFLGATLLVTSAYLEHAIAHLHKAKAGNETALAASGSKLGLEIYVSRAFFHTLSSGSFYPAAWRR